MEEMFMYQRILVPLDGSKQAESALPLAGKLARVYNAEITLLRVVEYPFEMYARSASNILHNPSQTDEKLQAEKEAYCREAEDYLKQLASTIEMTLSQVAIEVQECPVVDAILRTTEKSSIDLIVMSTVGQDDNPWMMGAITNRILREAPVPVILIRKGSYSLVPDWPRQQGTSIQKEVRVDPDTLSY
jgi:nucleotide-binding universal stress UspA family protein